MRPMQLKLILSLLRLSAQGSLTDLVQGHEPLRIRVLSYNIHHGEGQDFIVDLERIARLINSVEPDVVALQEVDCQCAALQSC